VQAGRPTKRCLLASAGGADKRTTAVNRCSVANRFRRYDTTERRSKLVVSYTRGRQGGGGVGSERGTVELEARGKLDGQLEVFNRFQIDVSSCDDVVGTSPVVKLLTNFRHIDVGR